jgi:uncharacterized protein
VGDVARHQAVLDRYTSAWLAGDIAAVAACYHDELTLHYAGANPLSGDHVGKPAAIAALREVSRRSNRRLLAVIDAMAGPERSAVVVREAFARDGLAVELERVLIYRIEDDRLRECWVYDTDQPLIDRLLAD